MLAVALLRCRDFTAPRGLFRLQTGGQGRCAETKWQERRLVVALRSDVVARRTRQRNTAIENLIALGKQWSNKLNGQHNRRVSKRIRAHVLVCFVALLLYRVMRLWQRRPSTAHL